MAMRLRKKSSAPMPPGRRPLQNQPARPANYTYYSQSARDAIVQPERAIDDRRRTPTTSWRTTFRLWLVRFGRLVAVLGVLALTISLLQVDTKPRLVIINSPQYVSLRPPKDYESAASNYLRGSLLNTNKLTIDAHGLAATLETQYPEINHATLVLPVVGHQSVLYLEMTKPALILSEQADPGSSALIDTKGRVLLRRPTAQLRAEYHLPVLIDMSNVPLQTGQSVLGSQTVDFIRHVVFQLQTQHIPTGVIMLPANAEEADVAIAGKPYFVKFNLHNPESVNAQIGTFVATKSSLERQGITPNQYIDVRVNGRAYFK